VKEIHGDDDGDRCLARHIRYHPILAAAAASRSPRSRSRRRKRALRTWKLAQPAEQRTNGLVFPDAAGNVEDHTTIYRRFGAAQLGCGISAPRLGGDRKPLYDKDGRPERRQKYGLHAIRHACASLLIAQGWQPKRLQAFMGHASIKLTYDVYGHLFVDAEGDQKAIARLESAQLG
jgi:integrase